ncbi:MAG: hypothetical protein NC223_05070 [Butyrivibrio sp.]|nr:hypothetical protein [Butyrivibrio sp.]
MDNSSRRHGSKKNRHYAFQLAMVAGLVTMLVCGIVTIGLMLFSNLFAEPLIAPNASAGYDHTNIYENITPSHTRAPDLQSGGETNGGDVPSEDVLSVEYVGGTVYAGGQAVAANFNVKLTSNDGFERSVGDYECAQLAPEYRLSEGDNVFEFKYGGQTASITLEAVSVRTFPYPPSYILRKVDLGAVQERIDLIDSGALSYEQAFANIAFTGDSQIKALAVDRILSMNRIVAENGESYDYLAAHFDEVVSKALGTEALIVHYGINTLSTSADERQKRINQYRELLVRLKEALPGTRIIVSGVFPVHYSIFGNQDRFVYIIEYDYALLEMCMAIGAEYLSDNAYMMEHQELFSQDGLHLRPEFYSQYWLKNIILTMGL